MPNNIQMELFSSLLAEYTTFDGQNHSFNNPNSKNPPGYFQYPAMMVPKIQQQLIQTICKVDRQATNILDPFVGSGTVLGEAMNQGLDFLGQDINPLAILLSKTKSGPFKLDILKDKIAEVISKILEDKNEQLEVDFNNLEKWFNPEVAKSLSLIKRAIQKENDLWVRRFFWVALAETVRLTSNSRISTFKLHIRPNNELESRNNLDVIKIFQNNLHKNYQSYSVHHNLLFEKNLLKEGHYTGKTELRHGDSSKEIISDVVYDILVTSPPYGDNTSTVPYGQHSYLPLQWIDFNDIDENINKRWLKTTQEIDRQSLGGSLLGTSEVIEELSELSPCFERLIRNLENCKPDRKKRVAAFCRDLNLSLDPILSALKPNAYMVWTVGNRRVGGQIVPIDVILTELLTNRGVTKIIELQREITPQKRMPNKNKIAPTMRAETILILRKGDE